MLEIVFVCSGNQCRSPYAEAYLQPRVPQWVSVYSAGTLQTSTARPPQDLLQEAEARGIDMSDHMSRPLENAHVEKADLVLGMKLEHVASALIASGAYPRRTFTFGDFVRLAEVLAPQHDVTDVDGARRVIDLAHQLRVDENNVLPVDDVEDPIGGPPAAYVAMADHLEALCDRLLAALNWV